MTFMHSGRLIKAMNVCVCLLKMKNDKESGKKMFEVPHFT